VLDEGEDAAARFDMVERGKLLAKIVGIIDKAGGGDHQPGAEQQHASKGDGARTVERNLTPVLQAKREHRRHRSSTHIDKGAAVDVARNC